MNDSSLVTVRAAVERAEAPGIVQQVRALLRSRDEDVFVTAHDDPWGLPSLATLAPRFFDPIYLVVELHLPTDRRQAEAGSMAAGVVDALKSLPVAVFETDCVADSFLAGARTPQEDECAANNHQIVRRQPAYVR